jgi:sporulation-control protein spo0M
MRVMIQLQEDAAMELHNQSNEMAGSSQAKPETERLLKATEELGLRLEPVHPGQTHPLLVPFFMIEVPDQETAEKTIRRLRRFKVVEAAYVKPDEQLP